MPIVERQAPLKPGDEVVEGTPGSGENVCGRCRGMGSIGDRACPECNGTGTVTTNIGDA